MNEQIKKMIVEHIEGVQTVIEREREICYKTRGPEVPDGFKIGQIPYAWIIDDGPVIVELKRAVQNIGIDNKTDA